MTKKIITTIKMKPFFNITYFFFSLAFILSLSAKCQVQINFTNPELGEVFDKGNTAPIAFNIQTSGTIQKVELCINRDEKIIDLTGKPYSYDLTNSTPGYTRAEVKVTLTGGAIFKSDRSFIINPDPFPSPPPAPKSNKKLKIFILAGQSNMEGYGMLTTNTPNTPGTLSFMQKMEPGKYDHLTDANSDHVIRNDVWNVFLDKNGAHTAGFGFGNNSNIGPELSFGNIMGDCFDDPVLLIKTAWGGKSLAIDFLPPSAANYKTPTTDGDSGFFYLEMINEIKDVLANINTHYNGPAYTGYEVMGFGWHQGWNDAFDDARNAAYEQNLVHLINDVRKDLNIPDLPFVTAVSGLWGWWNIPGATKDNFTDILNLIHAQSVITDSLKYPAFKGNTGFAETRSFARYDDLASGSQGFHWYQNFDSYYKIGEALAHAMLPLIKPKTITNLSNETDLPFSEIKVIGNRKINATVANNHKAILLINNALGQNIQQKTFQGSTSLQLKKEGLYLITVKSQTNKLTKKIYIK